MKTPSRQRPSSPSPRQSSRPAAIIIAIASVLVIALVATLLVAVDWSGIFRDDADPTPDYNADAIATRQAAVAANPESVSDLTALASELAGRGRIDEAIPYYEQALALEPENSTIRLDFARSLQNNDKPHDAEAQFLKVIAIDPANYEAHYYLAQLYLDAFPTRSNDAIGHLQQVVALAPDSFLAEQATTQLRQLSAGTPAASPQATP